MKNKKYIQWITVLGLIVIFALQAIWLRNTYVLIKNDIKKECNNILEQALNKEVGIISCNTPKNTAISGGSPNDSISVYTYLYNSLWEMKLEYSITRIDSLAGVHLKSVNIDRDFFICTVNPKTQSIIKKSKALNIPLWGAVKSQIVPTRLDRSEGIQLILVSPYYTIFERMGLLIIATALLSFFVIGCITYQIKIINHQNKVAKIREDFSYAMVHDMKTPLSTIMSTLDFLHSGRLDNKAEMKEKYFNIARSEADHLLALTNKVLTLSKLENHKLSMSKKEVLLAPMIEKLIDNFTAKSSKPVHFTTELKVETVYADEEYLAEVISNLIDNAIKYSKESVEIKISSLNDNLHTIIKVYDNGLGIAEKDKRCIFEKFERAAATKRSRSGGATGFGLGLNFVLQVVSAHDGNIFVNSIEGEYSEFSIHLPLILSDL
ncbi:HAMP domain-containing sensor histidine kinase [Bacteroides sp.]|uniref:sensor histidine kinase n=1 Tax=Bacteroides sp. TaxID=29523 RepID=UPI00261EBA77|nr:HAMP domain-containing sensor histidine kinase [Bacteroides sp.]